MLKNEINAFRLFADLLSTAPWIIGTCLWAINNDNRPFIKCQNQ